MSSSFKHLAGGVAAIAMVAAPVAAFARPAQAGPAAKLSVAGTRAASAPANAGDLRGGNSTLINLGIFAVLVVGVLLATTTGDDDDDSASN
ncbi:hypothetical protein [uncultured Sphingomonas sp.]|uniref:hypothetical protein n=1 Tax=uncultured Sphingomonas sp. TaxID=158754 RepID=UPI0035CAEF8F